MSDTLIDQKTTEAMYDAWHRLLDTVAHTRKDPHPGVLIEELLGPDDGPYPTEGLKL